jgi:hypothetical protein
MSIMATNNWDARIKLLYPADDGTDFTADTVTLDDPFDVVANVEVGRRLMEIADSDEVFVSVRNVSQSTVILSANAPRTLVPVDKPLNEDLRIHFASGWGGKAKEGDLLEVVATYRLDAGIHTDYSYASSQRFIVTK